MQKSWQAIGTLITTQFLLARLFGDVVKYLPTPFNLQVLLVRWRIRRFLARRRAKPLSAFSWGLKLKQDFLTLGDC